jgi:hypothetical protein
MAEEKDSSYWKKYHLINQKKVYIYSNSYDEARLTAYDNEDGARCSVDDCLMYEAKKILHRHLEDDQGDTIEQTFFVDRKGDEHWVCLHTLHIYDGR